MTKREWKTPAVKRLAQALLTLQTEEEVLAFLRDVCTIAEINEMSGRFAAVELLNAGEPIRNVAEKTGLSTTTVSRVSQWKNSIGEGGYDLVLSRIR